MSGKPLKTNRERMVLVQVNIAIQKKAVTQLFVLPSMLVFLTVKILSIELLRFLCYNILCS